MFWKAEDDQVRCMLCPRRCLINEGKKGYCGVREVREGTLIALTHSLPCSMAVDPIEKKPLHHFMPGTSIFSIATIGCNLSCKWCQNHDISHPEGRRIIAPYGEVSPEQVIALCKESGAPSIAFTYTEPTIYYEYMLDIAKLAKQEGLNTVLVSNGYTEQEPLRTLIPFLDAANIDLKSFSDEEYVSWTGAHLQPVLDTIKRLHQEGVHLELTTLIVPGVNDSEEELAKLYDWVSEELGEEQVVHISRFFPDHRLLDTKRTPMETMERAASIAKKRLRHVHLGNV